MDDTQCGAVQVEDDADLAISRVPTLTLRPEPPRRRARSSTVTMTEESLRAMAADWYRRGFGASGDGFHGEVAGVIESRAVGSLLEADFNRQWETRRLGGG